MDTCQALIIGGGPAGSSCAWGLRQGGMDVLLLDKEPFPRDKVCAGWITPAVFKALQLDITDYNAGRVLQPITAFRTGMIGGPTLDTDYDRAVSYGIRRCEFDHYLLQRADARLCLGKPLTSLERHGDGWLINDSIRSPMLVGAGGHFCPVARQLNNGDGPKGPVVAAKEVEFALSLEQARACSVQPQRPELYFCPDLKGYGWCVRKGDFLNIGLGREDSHGLSGQLQTFTQWLQQQGRIPGDIPGRFHGHAYRLYGHAPHPLLAYGVLLVGDAAGLAYPQSGEGIRPAVESGLLAAQAILEARGDYRRQNLEPYAQRLRDHFGPGEEGTAWLPAPLQQYLADRLLGSRRFTRHVLLDRWFLHQQQQALHLGRSTA